MAVIGVLGGFIFGVLVSALVFLRRGAQVQSEAQVAKASLAAKSEEVTGLRAELEQQKVEHRNALDNLTESLKDFLKGTSADVLSEVAQNLERNQNAVQSERDKQLGLKLEPLKEMVEKFREKVEATEKDQNKAIQDVLAITQQVLNTNNAVKGETEKLNLILGRSDTRGRFGEIQLENILQAAGFVAGVDYEMQFTVTGEESRLRPDCVMNMANGTRIAIDAKFPFEAFNRALDATDGATRTRLMKEHASALKGHLNTLIKKDYAAKVQPAPSFVICFVPSEEAVIEAAIADPELLSYAAANNVAVASPSSLLPLMWSVQFVVRQFVTNTNAEEIVREAAQLVERLASAYKHVNKMGQSLNTSVRAYNDMVGSFESRFSVTANRIQTLSGKRQDEIPELTTADTFTRPLNTERWTKDPDALGPGTAE